MKRLVLIMTLVAILVLPFFGIKMEAGATSGSTGVTGSLTIPATCGISTNATSLAFGTVAPATVSVTKTLAVGNTGSVDASVTLVGTAWTSGSGSFAAGQTHYGVSLSGTPPPTSYGSMTAVPTTTTTIGSILAQQQNATTWAVQVPSNVAFSGTVSQTLTLGISC